MFMGGLSESGALSPENRSINRQNRLRFVYTHFKSCDESLDETSFDFSNIFRVMPICATSGKSIIILKLPESMVT